MIDIIPAIDIIEGKCVRLLKGEYDNITKYSEDPLSIAQKFEKTGLQRLHIVDLEGAKEKKLKNIEILKLISKNTNLLIDYGGGISNSEDLEIIFSAGAKKVSIGSLAITNPVLIEEWINKFGTDKIILCADVKDYKIHINGWTINTNISIFDFIKRFKEMGIKEFLSTDISKDGTLKGPSFDYYKILKDKFSDIYLIASGGVHDINDIIKLNQSGIDAVIVGKALYENKITLEDLSNLKNKIC